MPSRSIVRRAGANAKPAIDRIGCRNGNRRRKSGERDEFFGASGTATRHTGAAGPPRRVTGHNVRFVLGFSVAAVVIVLAIIWLVYFA